MMRRLIVIALLLCGGLYAKPYKAVYDLSMSDMRFVLNRVMLIEKTAAMLKENGETPEFVITIHSGATPIMAKMPDMYADEQDVPVVYNIHETLKRLKESYGVRIVGCNMAANAYGMEADELLPLLEMSPNSIIELIGLQNSGYAAVYFVR